MFVSPLFQELSFRGFIKNSANLDALDVLARDGHIAVYAGFDCTADSLHIGNMMTLRMLSIFAKHNHRVIALIGTATTLVGDPSGKDKTRPMMTMERMNTNKDGIMESIRRVVPDAEIVFNGDWITPMSWLSVLRDFGPHISVNKMLTLDSVKSRLDKQEHMSFLEFNYSLMQAVDFLTLAQDCKEPLVQIGGSDQWGNIVMGTELIGKVTDKTSFAITHPLLMDANGNKMGKSVEGTAVWLNSSKASDFEFFQFWRNINDSDIENCLKIFTDFSEAEIASFLIGNPNVAKEALAVAVTTIVRGKQNALACRALSRGEANEAEMVTLEEGETLWSRIIARLGFAENFTDARRKIAGGAIKINGVSLMADREICDADFVENKALVRTKRKAVSVVRPQ